MSTTIEEALQYHPTQDAHVEVSLPFSNLYRVAAYGQWVTLVQGKTQYKVEKDTLEFLGRKEFDPAHPHNLEKSIQRAFREEFNQYSPLVYQWTKAEAPDNPIIGIALFRLTAPPTRR